MSVDHNVVTLMLLHIQFKDENLRSLYLRYPDSILCGSTWNVLNLKVFLHVLKPETFRSLGIIMLLMIIYDGLMMIYDVVALQRIIFTMCIKFQSLFDYKHYT